MNLDKYIRTTQDLLREIAEELGDPKDLDRAARVLRIVLHVLRERLQPQESLDLIAQLPMIVKAWYVDGWRLSDGIDKSLRTLDDLADEMVILAQRTASYDFPDTRIAIQAARAVFVVLKKHVSEGEVNDVAAELPRDLKRLWASA